MTRKAKDKYKSYSLNPEYDVGNSNDWNRLLSKGIRHSMSRKGNCWNNAGMKSLLPRLKVESLYADIATTKQEVYLLVADTPNCFITEYDGSL